MGLDICVSGDNSDGGVYVVQRVCFLIVLHVRDVFAWIIGGRIISITEFGKAMMLSK